MAAQLGGKSCGLKVCFSFLLPPLLVFACSGWLIEWFMGRDISLKTGLPMVEDTFLPRDGAARQML